MTGIITYLDREIYIITVKHGINCNPDQICQVKAGKYNGLRVYGFPLRLQCTSGMRFTQYFGHACTRHLFALATVFGCCSPDTRITSCPHCTTLCMVRVAKKESPVWNFTLRILTSFRWYSRGAIAKKCSICYWGKTGADKMWRTVGITEVVLMQHTACPALNAVT